MGLCKPQDNGNHDLWVKLYNLSRVFKTDISAVLTVKSGLDPHRLKFLVKGKWLMEIMVMMVVITMVMVMVHAYLFNMFYCLYDKRMGYANHC